MIRIIFSVLILVAGLSVKAGVYTGNRSPAKVIIITVNESGLVYMSRDTMSIESITAELQNRLWKSYMGTGKMYDSVYLQFNGEVVADIKSAAVDAIREAQKKVLISICLEKYNKLFADINSRQQDKIRKLFPVLFQQNF